VRGEGKKTDVIKNPLIWQSLADKNNAWDKSEWVEIQGVFTVKGIKRTGGKVGRGPVKFNGSRKNPSKKKKGAIWRKPEPYEGWRFGVQHEKRKGKMSSSFASTRNHHQMACNKYGWVSGITFP